MITKIILLVTATLIDLMMIGFGLLFFRRSPESINAFFGYRTVRSMASPDAWAFAHRHFGKLSLILGAIWTPLSLGAISLLSFGGVEQYEPICAMLVLAQLIPFLVAIISTERALKRRFHSDGTPRISE